MADPTTTRLPHKPWYAELDLQVLAAILRGVLLGHFNPQTGEAMKPIGDAFIKLVRMIIAPVIFLTIVTEIAGMRDLGPVGRVGTKAFAYSLFFSTLALFVAILFGRANMRW
jgi:aerobic C4-dicarboxylate transport protein